MSAEVEPPIEMQVRVIKAGAADLSTKELGLTVRLTTVVETAPEGVLKQIPLGPGNRDPADPAVPGGRAMLQLRCMPLTLSGEPIPTFNGMPAERIFRQDSFYKGAPALTLDLLVNGELDEIQQGTYAPATLVAATLTKEYLSAGFSGDMPKDMVDRQLRTLHLYRLSIPWDAGDQSLKERYDIPLHFHKALHAATGLSKFEWRQSLDVSYVDWSQKSVGFGPRGIRTETSVAFNPDFDNVNILAGQGAIESAAVYNSSTFSGLSEATVTSLGLFPGSRISMRASSSRRKDISDFLLFGLAALFGAAAASLFDLVMGSLKAD